MSRALHVNRKLKCDFRTLKTCKCLQTCHTQSRTQIFSEKVMHYYNWQKEEEKQNKKLLLLLSQHLLQTKIPVRCCRGVPPFEYIWLWHITHFSLNKTPSLVKSSLMSQYSHIVRYKIHFNCFFFNVLTGFLTPWVGSNIFSEGLRKTVHITSVC